MCELKMHKYLQRRTHTYTQADIETNKFKIQVWHLCWSKTHLRVSMLNKCGLLMLLLLLLLLSVMLMFKSKRSLGRYVEDVKIFL